MRGKSVQRTKLIAFTSSFQLARERKLIYKQTVNVCLVSATLRCVGTREPARSKAGQVNEALDKQMPRKSAPITKVLSSHLKLADLKTKGNILAGHYTIRPSLPKELWQSPKPSLPGVQRKHYKTHSCASASDKNIINDLDKNPHWKSPQQPQARNLTVAEEVTRNLAEIYLRYGQLSRNRLAIVLKQHWQ